MVVTRSAGASKRMEALSDGIIAIVATLLVLEIRVPKLPESHTPQDMMHAIGEMIPSLVAFLFSFLNILVFWFNHDSIGKVLYYFDRKVSFLNFFFLLFISLVPFTTAYVSEFPQSKIAVTAYGIVLFSASLVAAWMYHHIAFHSNMMHASIKLTTRRKIWRKVMMGPIAFLVAILLGWVHPMIPISVYILMPLFFMFMPAMDISDQLTSDEKDG